MIAEADALHRRVQAVVAAYGFPSGESFAALADALARHQAANDVGYARLCAARGVTPGSTPPAGLPAVPTDAFKLLRIASFPAGLAAATFRTSGTTVGARGAHELRRLDTYRAAALETARRLLVPEGATVLAIAETPAAAPDSSLSCMLGWFVEAFGGAFVHPTDTEGVVRALAATDRPVLVAATAFAWVHLVDAGVRVRLPAASRAMQTGGFKGRSREVSPAELRAAVAHGLGLSPGDVVGEYGMTELSSQLYAPQTSDGRFVYVAPPWVRVVACDPDTLAPLPAGTEGVLRIEDLANVESAWAVQTADLGVVDATGRVELLGRAPGAAPRGCSLAVEELLDR